LVGTEAFSARARELAAQLNARDSLGLAVAALERAATGGARAPQTVSTSVSTSVSTTVQTSV
jgi:hypothetical protein